MFEIEGDPKQEDFWVAQTGCPASGEATKSVFCPHRAQCDLPEILVRAGDDREARVFAEYAASTGQIPSCLNGKPFLTKMFEETINFQPTFIE